MPCAGFGTSGTQGYWLDLGADAQNKDDIPARVVWFASQLYVVGETDTGSGATENRAAFAINVNPSSGNRNHPSAMSLRTLACTCSTLTSLPTAATPPTTCSPTRRRRSSTGFSSSAKRSIPPPAGEDTDGFVVSVNGATGQEDGFMNTQVYADLGTKHKDKLLRVMQRRNGGFVVAGTAMDDSASPRSSSC
jgi:hypothetical protein